MSNRPQIELVCCGCKKTFDRDLSDYKYKIKIGGENRKFFCSRSCLSKYRHKNAKNKADKPKICSKCFRFMKNDDIENTANSYRFYELCKRCRGERDKNHLKERKIRQTKFLLKWDKMKSELF